MLISLSSLFPEKGGTSWAAFPRQDPLPFFVSSETHWYCFSVSVTQATIINIFKHWSLLKCPILNWQTTEVKMWSAEMLNFLQENLCNHPLCDITEGSVFYGISSSSCHVLSVVSLTHLDNQWKVFKRPLMTKFTKWARRFVWRPSCRLGPNKLKEFFYIKPTQFSQQVFFNT